MGLFVILTMFGGFLSLIMILHFILEICTCSEKIGSVLLLGFFVFVIFIVCRTDSYKPDPEIVKEIKGSYTVYLDGKDVTGDYYTTINNNSRKILLTTKNK